MGGCHTSSEAGQRWTHSSAWKGSGEQQCVSAPACLCTGTISGQQLASHVLLFILSVLTPTCQFKCNGVCASRVCSVLWLSKGGSFCDICGGLQAGSDHQEVLDAYDSALAASAAKVQEAQEAAAALAAQLTDTELQLQQLHHACSNSALLGVARGLESDLGTGIIGSDAAAVAMAVAAAGGRCKNSKSPTRSKHAAALPADLECSRGMRALRQHQKHLEQQLSKQQQDVTRLQRENLKLLRYKKQWTTAVSRLQGATAAQEAAAAAAEEAGLRAAAANGRADRLQQQVRLEVIDRRSGVICTLVTCQTCHRRPCYRLLQDSYLDCTGSAIDCEPMQCATPWFITSSAYS